MAKDTDEKFYQGFVLTDHPLGDIAIRIYADKVQIKQGVLLVDVPLTEEGLVELNAKIDAMEERSAGSSTH